MVYFIIVWSHLKLNEVKLLEEVDEFLIRSVFKAHSKTCIEFLYLETGTKPIRFIIASRRLNYLHNILKKPDHELIKRIYNAQKVKTSKGDWIELVKKDFELIGEQFDEEMVKQMSKNKFKQFVKQRIEKAAFNHLETTKQKHSKVKQINYKKLEPQPYVLSEDFKDEQICELFALRSRMVQVKRNFIGKFRQDLLCSLGCVVEETQDHLLDCKLLIDKMKDISILAEVETSDLFGTVQEQLAVTRCFSEILHIRENLLQP